MRDTDAGVLFAVYRHVSIPWNLSGRVFYNEGDPSSTRRLIELAEHALNVYDATRRTTGHTRFTPYSAKTADVTLDDFQVWLSTGLAYTLTDYIKIADLKFKVVPAPAGSLCEYRVIVEGDDKEPATAGMSQLQAQRLYACCIAGNFQVWHKTHGHVVGQVYSTMTVRTIKGDTVGRLTDMSIEDFTVLKLYTRWRDTTHAVFG